jgi:hypothetical protein
VAKGLLREGTADDKSRSELVWMSREWTAITTSGRDTQSTGGSDASHRRIICTLMNASCFYLINERIFSHLCATQRPCGAYDLKKFT